MIRNRSEALLAVLVGLCAVVGFSDALHEAPWEDEFSSMRSLDSLYGYRFMPAYFLYLRVGEWFGRDLLWLRVWSFLPWFPALWLSFRLLAVVGARHGDALATVALLALNPFLLQECMGVRYYAFFFFAAVLALNALLFLLEGRGTVAARVGACLLLILPQLTVYSGVSVLAIGGLVGFRRGMAGRSTRSLCFLGGLVAVALLLVVAPILRVMPPGEDWSFPLDMGYAKAPADLWSLAYQYNKLLGWNYFSWHVSPRIVEGATLLLFVVAGLNYARGSQGLKHRAVIVLAALLPLAVWGLSVWVNLLGPRYYLHVSLPVTFMVVLLARSLWARTRVLRRLGISTLVVLTLASLTLSLRIPTQPPLFALEKTLVENKVKRLSVLPPWYGQVLTSYFRWRRVPIKVQVWRGREASFEAEWIFRKDPSYTRQNVVRKRKATTKLIASYRAVDRFQSLKKYYFHAGRLTDYLLQKKPVKRRR